jgi:hypothetical protein
LSKAAERLTDADRFTHPDAQRRFRVMRNAEEHERAAARLELAKPSPLFIAPSL